MMTGVAAPVRHHWAMRRYQARAEFRRRTRGSRWVLAGVSIGGRFLAAAHGIERIRARLPEPGLVAWTDLPDPILATNLDQALTIALDVARARWPRHDQSAVPFPSGTADP